MNRSERIIEIKRLANAISTSREYLEVQDECIQVGFKNVGEALTAYRSLCKQVLEEQRRCKHLVNNPLLREKIDSQMELIRGRGLQNGRISFDNSLVTKLSREIPLSIRLVIGEMRGYVRALAMLNYYESDLAVDGHFAQRKISDTGQIIFSSNVFKSTSRLAQLSEKAKVYLENIV